MEIYDLLMLGVLVFATAFGARKGLAWQIASVASIFASYFVAYQYRLPVAALIKAEAPWNMFAAMLILYLGCSLGIWLTFRLVSGLIDSVKLQDFDRHAGAVLGFGRGVLWCVIITMFAVTLLGESERQTIVRSRSGHYIAQLLDRSYAVLPGELHQVLDPYMRTIDQRLGQTESGPPNMSSPASPSKPWSAPYGANLPPAYVPPPTGGNTAPYQTPYRPGYPEAQYEDRR